MDQEPPFWPTLLTQIMAIPVIGIAFMGAMGGATNGLVVRVSFKQLIRYTILGAMCAAGSGQLSGTILVHYGIMPESIASASAGAIAFFAGLFFPALFEVILSRIKSGKHPNDLDKS